MKTKLGWLAALIGVVLGWVVWQMMPTYLAMRETFGTTIESVKVVAVSPDKPALALAVRAQILVSSHCQRLTHYAMVETKSRMVFPLGQTISGAGFGAPWPGHYEVMLNIPPTIEPGRYHLAVRSVYTCSWLGLFDRTVSEEIERVPIEIR